MDICPETVLDTASNHKHVKFGSLNGRYRYICLGLTMQSSLGMWSRATVNFHGFMARNASGLWPCGGGNLNLVNGRTISTRVWTNLVGTTSSHGWCITHIQWDLIYTDIYLMVRDLRKRRWDLRKEDGREEPGARDEGHPRKQHQRCRNPSEVPGARDEGHPRKQHQWCRNPPTSGTAHEDEVKKAE